MYTQPLFILAAASGLLTSAVNALPIKTRQIGNPMSFLPVGTSLEGLKTITPVPVNINTETPVNTSGMFNGVADATAKSTSSGISAHDQTQTPPGPYGPAGSHTPGSPYARSA